ncbi:uncharacterized protein Z518_05790 [Rhinocladiella mackenziei CBS 650.93]|uniref:HTH La-type RNA-binding domain-containing protein n=1 Tax=Rhinocladiella mackenziei CBS 650.93 TaxID=1442369 RepID=A0A0D2IGN1_9EURO|nr:uncharacterized protein Z518_05790 [Rhinocladiella mackenziei CBS 650.93]KIX04919.1 hypothetical protein Z518_05790 [Rhinocladiella mackenziei CBS 650.93]
MRNFLTFSEKMASSTGSAPVFSYAQAAKGLTPASSTQATSRNESPAASDKSAKDRVTTEQTSNPSAGKTPRSKTESEEKQSKESSSTKSSTKDATENAPPAPRSQPPSPDDKSSSGPGSSPSIEPKQDVQKDAPSAQLQNGRTPSEPSPDSSSPDKGSQGAAEKKSKDGEDDWEKVSVEKELKAAPIPAVNVWQQRKEAQAARMKERAEQRATIQNPSNAVPKPKSGNEDSKRRVAHKDGSSEREGKNADATRSNAHRKDISSARPSRPVSRQGEKAGSEVPPPVGDAQLWPTPESSNTDERRKSTTYEKADKAEAKGNGQKSYGNNWKPFPFVPTAKFETQLPASARRGGRGARGRDSNGRGSHLNSAERHDSTASMGPPPLPKPSGEQDRGRRSEDYRGARGASVPTGSTVPASGDDASSTSRKVSAPLNQEQAGTDHVGVVPPGEDQAPRTGQSSRSSSRHTGRVAGRMVNGENNTSTEQFSGGWVPSGDQSNRYSYPFDRFKGAGTGATRGNGEFARDRGAGRNRDWSRDKPDSAREKVESWRDREPSGDQSSRRENRPERGRGGYRGRGNHTYNPPFSAHAYTSPLPQNGFEPARSNSHSESRSRQTSQPYQPNQPASTTRNNPRSQSIPVSMMFPGYYNGVPAMPGGLPPLQTDMQMYGYPQMHMQPGIMSAMPYNDPLNSYALLSMVMTQVEYYFSIDNLCKDLYLRKHMDGQGYVPLSVIANFKRIKALTEDNMTMDTLRQVCQQVKSVEFLPGTDGDDRIRRRENWRDFVLPIEERLESARNDGPAPNPDQYNRPSQPESSATFDPSFGLGQLRSPSLSVAATNGAFHANSPMSYLPGAQADGQMANGPFVPSLEDNSDDAARRTSIASFAPAAGAVRSSPSHGSGPMADLVNGHRRQVSRADIEENVFPDENIPNINIRMQPRHFGGQSEPFPLPDMALMTSHESSGGPNEGNNATMNVGPSRVASLRGGTSSPQQLEQLRHLSFGFSSFVPMADESSVIYVTKDGQETQLPPPQLGQYDQTYQSLHDVAFQQRQHGVEGALEPLYSFWSDFLVDKFNLGMYQEFKTSAVNDLQEGNDSGMTHLVRYYGKLLSGPVPVSERLASDMVTLAREEKRDDRPIFHTLRAAWRNGATNMKTMKRLSDILTAEEKAEFDKSG